MNRYADTVSHGTNLVRSLRFNDENYSVVGGKALIDAEERVNFISALLSKISEKIPVNVKLTLWEFMGKSSSSVKKRLGMEKLKGTQLEAHKNFPFYLKYADRIEKHDLELKAEGSYSTFNVWTSVGLDKKIGNLDDLKKNLNTDEYRFYKRYVNIFEENRLHTKDSGYTSPEKNDPDTSEIEKLARAQVWGETGMDSKTVKSLLGLKEATEAQLRKNQFYQHYKNTYQPRRTSIEEADKAALKKFLLAAE
ncbi:Secreted RxLR effector peptide protein [Phytophthora palmivora]|uniref:Secreted RxLR effector peptide protein n=1 Tax=Phytophthora palmivora TaxID=4796 RepID=A0A2P4X3J4_9STRA|nr:Secreted RxLR effector peptide protein [Phytophthora palmivora]